MKRILAFVLACCFIFVFVGCGAEQAQKEIFDFVEENYDVIVQACQEEDADTLSNMDGIEEVRVLNGYVLVYCQGHGIAPSSQDYGFYYSEENLPVTIDCTLSINGHAEDLTPEGNGYQYVESGNVFYTEHIKGNIYFYSNAY